ncbi:MAG: three-Cys-motif partner protein TcmP [Dehalococcoidia bacterium]|nr:three-Cys-motif partner protein TcmP [Dehalococcoidia bacterium]
MSGVTGSQLKSEVIGLYYPFWWNITSGGKRANYDYPTAIVELHAATGEVFIEDTGDTILGSAGHALDLKCSNPNAGRLQVILVEKDAECYAHLKNVIHRRWRNIETGLAEGAVQENTSGVYLLNVDLDTALSTVRKMKLGNALLFFDPLRSVDYGMIETVAVQRLTSYYATGTEFMVFTFTSDWFLGRDDLAPLPTSLNEDTWSADEKRTVLEADALFGGADWRIPILNDNPVAEREDALMSCYRKKLHKWFRYVLPMPFNPKRNQIFHLVLCSNYEIGVKATRDFYCDVARNPRYSPDNTAAYGLFQQHHPELFVGLKGRQRPAHWRLLWTTLKNHEEGICDCMCSDYVEIEKDAAERQHLLDWLEQKGYVIRIDLNDAWHLGVKQYQLNWVAIEASLGVAPPCQLTPLGIQ